MPQYDYMGRPIHASQLPPEKTPRQICYEQSLANQIGEASRWECQRANYLEAQAQATAQAAQSVRDQWKTHLNLIDTLADKVNTARGMEIVIYGEPQSWKLENFQQTNYDWWSKPDNVLDYFLMLREKLGQENPLRTAEIERQRLVKEAAWHRSLQNRLNNIVTQGHSTQNTNWHYLWSGVMSDPSLRASIINWTNKYNANDSSGILDLTPYIPDKKPGGLLAKIGREFNKGLANMGPLGKVVKPLINLAAMSTGNPYIVIATSVTLGALDGGKEGALKGYVAGIGAVAAMKLPTGELSTITTDIVKTTCITVPIIVNQTPNKGFYKGVAGMVLGTVGAKLGVEFLLEGQNSFVIVLSEGAIYGMIANKVTGKDIWKGAFDNAFFAGLGEAVNRGLGRLDALKEAHKLRSALEVGIKSTVNLIVHGGKLEDIVIAVGGNVLSNYIVPKGKNSEFLQTYVTGIIAALTGKGELGEHLVASMLGKITNDIMAKQERSEEEELLIIQYGQELDNTKLEHRWGKAELERQSPKMREKAYNTNKEIIKNKHNLVLAHNEHANDLQFTDLNEKLEALNDYFSKPPTEKEDGSLWETAVKAVNGDENAQVEMRHRMPKLAAVFDGIREGTIIGSPIQEVGLTVLGGSIGVVGVSTNVKTGGKLLFSYKMYQKLEQTNRSKITGGRTVKEEMARDKIATQMYEEIRNTTSDVQQVSKNLNLPEFQVQRVKDHLFYNKHQLKHDAGFERFDPDFDIANAWKRLEAGTHNEADLKIFKHEHFESRFEGIFRTDYETAHKAANDAGYPSGLRNNEIIEVKNGNANLHK